MAQRNPMQAVYDAEDSRSMLERLTGQNKRAKADGAREERRLVLEDIQEVTLTVEGPDWDRQRAVLDALNKVRARVMARGEP